MESGPGNGSNLNNNNPLTNGSFHMHGQCAVIGKDIYTNGSGIWRHSVADPVLVTASVLIRGPRAGRVVQLLKNTD